VQVNKLSRHAFLNTKQAEVVIGGARDGANEVQFTVRNTTEGKRNEALTIRVYLLSEVAGVMPVKVFEYLCQEGTPPKTFGSDTFVVDAAILNRLAGR